MKNGRNTLILFLILLSSGFTQAQSEETLVTEVIGSFPFGEKEITVLYDKETECEWKTSPHESHLFTTGEQVSIKITANGETAEILKEGLSEPIFADKECESALRQGNHDKISVSCDGSCTCSLEGVLSEESSYVSCSCETCTMQITFSDNARGTSSTFTLEDAATMEIPLLADFMTYVQASFTSYILSHIEIFRDGDDVAVSFDFTDDSGVEHSIMFAKIKGKTYQISCDGPCGCREVYSFETNSASCSCDDCVMTVEEVGTN